MGKRDPVGKCNNLISLALTVLMVCDGECSTILYLSHFLFIHTYFSLVQITQKSILKSICVYVLCQWLMSCVTGGGVQG